MIIKAMTNDKITYEYEINTKNLRGLLITIVSGDHLITPLYEDGHFDSSIDPNKSIRHMDFYEGTFFVETFYLDKYNNIESPYDLFAVDWAEQINIIKNK